MKQPRANKKVSAIMNEVEWAGGDIIVLITKKWKSKSARAGRKDAPIDRVLWPSVLRMRALFVIVPVV